MMYKSRGISQDVFDACLEKCNKLECISNEMKKEYYSDTLLSNNGSNLHARYPTIYVIKKNIVYLRAEHLLIFMRKFYYTLWKYNLREKYCTLDYRATREDLETRRTYIYIRQRHEGKL